MKVRRVYERIDDHMDGYRILNKISRDLGKFAVDCISSHPESDEKVIRNVKKTIKELEDFLTKIEATKYNL